MPRQSRALFCSPLPGASRGRPPLCRHREGTGETGKARSPYRTGQAPVEEGTSLRGPTSLKVGGIGIENTGRGSLVPPPLDAQYRAKVVSSTSPSGAQPADASVVVRSRIIGIDPDGFVIVGEGRFFAADSRSRSPLVRRKVDVGRLVLDCLAHVIDRFLALPSCLSRMPRTANDSAPGFILTAWSKSWSRARSNRAESLVS